MYHYDTCGLDNVYLLNGYKEMETAGGHAVSIHNLDGLHQAIAEELVQLRRGLTGNEFRFLRVELDMSQKALAEILDKSDQSIAKWEKEEVNVPVMADMILRLLYMESVGKDSKVRNLINTINKLDRRRQEYELRFHDSPEGWKAVGE